MLLSEAVDQFAASLEPVDGLTLHAPSIDDIDLEEGNFRLKTEGNLFVDFIQLRSNSLAPQRQLKFRDRSPFLGNRVFVVERLTWLHWGHDSVTSPRSVDVVGDSALRCGSKEHRRRSCIKGIVHCGSKGTFLFISLIQLRFPNSGQQL